MNILIIITIMMTMECYRAMTKTSNLLLSLTRAMAMRNLFLRTRAISSEITRITAAIIPETTKESS